MGMNYGYKRSLRFLTGITAGYSLIMLLSAFLSGSLIQLIPAFEPVIRTLGTSYILWLAYGTAKASYDYSSEVSSYMNFKHGFLIQALNPKALVFGLTIYTTFLSSLNNRPIFSQCFNPVFNGPDFFICFILDLQRNKDTELPAPAPCKKMVKYRVNPAAYLLCLFSLRNLKLF